MKGEDAELGLQVKGKWRGGMDSAAAEEVGGGE
jgi:hypothetical protein